MKVANSETPDAGRPGDPLRVLVVEDEALVAVMLETMLEDLGHSIANTASTLDQALSMATAEELDLAILDVNLDGEMTYPVADILAQRGIPFAFASGYGQEYLPEAYRTRPTLAKPYQAHDLEAVLKRLSPAVSETRPAT